MTEFRLYSTFLLFNNKRLMTNF